MVSFHVSLTPTLFAMRRHNALFERNNNAHQFADERDISLLTIQLHVKRSLSLVEQWSNYGAHALANLFLMVRNSATSALKKIVR